jgi:LPXTG-motif cell wall-anchored protein
MLAARRRTVLAAVLLAGGLPVGAAAQTAGDEQYQDPFGGAPEPTPAPEDPAPAQPAQDPAPVPDAAPAAAPAPATAAAPPSQLPYTGSGSGLVALAGALMVAGGVTFRIRLRERA